MNKENEILSYTVVVLMCVVDSTEYKVPQSTYSASVLKSKKRKLNKLIIAGADGRY